MNLLDWNVNELENKGEKMYINETPTVGNFRAFFYHDGLAISQKRVRNFAFRF